MQNFIDNASSASVVNGASFIKANFLGGNLVIHQNNPLVLDSTNAIRQFARGRAAFTQDEMNSYLASSVLLHNLDGWVYLSNAVDSLFNGDTSVALHLAYYSELRASMSFLASQGIGIFNNRHVNVDGSNRTNLNPPIPQCHPSGAPIMRGGRHLHRDDCGTHVFTWLAIEHWVNSAIQPPGTDLLKVFSVSGKTFDQWISKFPNASPVVGTQIIKRWLKKWNADVRFYPEDRNARNIASYHPQRQLNVAPVHTLNEVIKKLTSFWELLAPDDTNRFLLLDKYLLRMLLQEIYSSLPTSIRTANTLQYLVEQTLTNLGLNHDKSFVDFLINTAPITNDLFVEASKDAIDPITNSMNPLSVIARATLVLRLSTGTANSIFTSAGILHSDFDFLWDKFGLEHGFWENGDYYNRLNDLWDEISNYVEDFNDFADEKAPTLCLNHLYTKRDIPEKLNFFKQFHRAGLWGYRF